MTAINFMTVSLGFKRRRNEFKILNLQKKKKQKKLKDSEVDLALLKKNIKDRRGDPLLQLKKMSEGQDTTEEIMITRKSTIKEEGLHPMTRKKEDAEGHLHHLRQTHLVHHPWDHHLQSNHPISKKKLRKSD